MSCYTRHLGELFEEAGLVNSRETRREADKRLRQMLDMAEEDCPHVWRELKARLARPEQRAQLVVGLKGLGKS